MSNASLWGVLLGFFVMMNAPTVGAEQPPDFDLGTGGGGGKGQASGLKIGVVDGAALMEKVAQREQTSKKLEREFSARQKKLKAEEEEVNKIKDRLVKEEGVLSEEEKAKLAKEGQKRFLDLRNAEAEYSQDFNQTRNEEQQKLFKIVIEAVQAVARDESYDLILDKGAALLARDSINVTAKVASKLESGEGSSKSSKKP
ncbi:MAG: hypothetical protein DM484_30000 [Candidatus Methylumidiphilus alinenensis]|uniref:Molecular chaperone Skp n=1 Tax=Candidatus Methylumidiphilus alinenensis TaxID=2202197 RepID=A0A2W4QDP5_9GAMM|nr:MAG: hypothetical protein DM484_30000 [Candidatus Methylumidiphilus alinenensis]